MIFKIKELLDSLLYPFYLLLGRRPWSGGYYTAKKLAICGGIDSGVMCDGSQLPPGYGYRIDERVVEYPWMFSQLPKSQGRLLDAGSALNHKFLVERAPLSQYELMVMTLAPEKHCFWYKGISYIFGDLRNTEFASGTFDVVASISTIEHIGLDNTLLYTSDVLKKEIDPLGFVPAVTEFKRLLKPGGICLITVPYGRRGVHGWYQIFDASLLSHVIEAFLPSQHSVDYFAYHPDGWQRSAAADIGDAEFFDVHSGSPYGPDFAAGARGVACIRLVA
jgi:SAM-dependent methyltransferase